MVPLVRIMHIMRTSDNLLLVDGSDEDERHKVHFDKECISNSRNHDGQHGVGTKFINELRSYLQTYRCHRVCLWILSSMVRGQILQSNNDQILFEK